MSDPRESKFGYTVIHQPNFFPRLKVLQKIANAKVWMVLDDVQYSPQEWQNRARITPTDIVYRSFWLTMPVSRPHGQQTLISEVKLINPNPKKIYNTLYQAYHQAVNWPTISELLDAIPRDSFESLTTLATAIVQATASVLSLPLPKPVFTSKFNIQTTKTRRLIDLCLIGGNPHYLSGSGSVNYLDQHEMEAAGIKVYWQKWVEPSLIQVTDPRLSSWRNVSFTDYLVRFEPKCLLDHLRDLHVVDSAEI